MISAGQQPVVPPVGVNSGSGPVAVPPVGAQPPSGANAAPMVTGAVIDPPEGMSENGCMYDRGNDYIEDVVAPDNKIKKEDKHRVSTFSVAGLTTYALRTAALLDPSVDETYVRYMHSAFDPEKTTFNSAFDVVTSPNGAQEKRATGAYLSIMPNAASQRVSMRSICALDDGRTEKVTGFWSSLWAYITDTTTLEDGSKQINWGSLRNNGVLHFDDAAGNWFTDLLLDNEHEDEQRALLKAMKDIGMDGWDNRRVHYLGAFGDGVFKTYMAQAFRGEGVEDGQKEGVKNYVAKVREALKVPSPADQQQEGVFVLLSAFAPLGMDKVLVVGALTAIGKATHQEEFAKVVAAGYDYNKAVGPLERVNKFYEAHAPEIVELMAKLQMILNTAKDPKKVQAAMEAMSKLIPNSVENKKDANEVMEAAKNIKDALSKVDDGQLTDDQKEFKYELLGWALAVEEKVALFAPQKEPAEQPKGNQPAKPTTSGQPGGASPPKPASTGQGGGPKKKSGSGVEERF